MGLVNQVTMIFIYLTIVTISSMGISEVNGKLEKRWPDFSCHHDKFIPADKSEQKMVGVAHQSYKKDWDECVRKEKDSGACAKVCFMEKSEMVNRWRDDRVGIEVGYGIMAHFRDSLRFNSEVSELPANKELKAIDRSIEMEMDKCEDKHENELLDLTFNEPCDKWNPFILCLEKAYGCV